MMRSSVMLYYFDVTHYYILWLHYSVSFREKSRVVLYKYFFFFFLAHDVK